MELASGSKIAKSVSGHTVVIHGSMNEYPWNLDMMMETFTHVHGCTLMLLCKSTGFLWKQDGFPWKLVSIYKKPRWISMETRWIHGNKMDFQSNKMDFHGN